MQPIAPPPRKGLHPLAWVGIGCVVILLIGAVAFGVFAFWAKQKIQKFADNPAMTAAEAVVRLNPDLDLVSKDDKAQTITIRDKKTGETTTVSLDDVKQGRFKFSNAEGKSATFDVGQQGATIKVQDEKGKEQATFSAGASVKNLPSWLPVYPGATTQGMLSATSTEGNSQMFAVNTPDSVDKVMAFYQSQLKASGFSVQPTVMAVGGQSSGGLLNATSADGKRTANIVVSSSDKGTSAAITFVEKP